MSVESIGVVGGGIGGLAAAWLLDKRYRVTLLERNAYVGGHTNTVMVEDPRGDFPVDTGFMVFNRRNYPLLCGLFAHLGVDSYATDMSFAASLDGGRLEYAGSDINGLFGQRSNLLSPGFLRMLADIVRFNGAAKAYLGRRSGSTLSLGDFLERGRYGARICNHYLLPMAAAIWSSPTERIRDFPFASFARFFNNHGLLDLSDRPEWRTVRGGSQVYVQRMLAQMGGTVRTDTAVVRVRRLAEGVEVETDRNERMQFDVVVLGCHGDEALRLVESPSPAEREILGAFRCQSNRVYLHQDPRLMPKRRRVWSSWNYLRGANADPSSPVTLTYWMNSLQDLPKDRNVFVSLNPFAPPRPETLLREMEYRHPLFDGSTMAAQARIGEIQGRDRLWFCGAWLGYGFHEDGLRAAVDVAGGLGVRVPWSEPRSSVGPRPAPAPAAVPASVSP